MSEVLIVGSESPSVELPRGEQRRVQYTEHVARLVDRGYVKILQWYDAPDDAVLQFAADDGHEPKHRKAGFDG